VYVSDRAGGLLSGSGAKCSDIERRRKSILAAGLVRNRHPDSEDQVKEVLLAGVRNRITLPGR
jgi:hypothetical protein